MEGDVCFFVLSSLMLFLHLVTLTSSHSDNALLLLVSFDGFRYDYLDKVKAAGKSTPNFDKFFKNGVKAEYVKNTFTTITFPNHFTIATGMYEENHGIVSNKFYDPVYKETFNIGRDATVPKWWDNGTSGLGGAEPIWITNQRGPQTFFKRRSGVFFWPGSEAPYGPDQMMPYHVEKFDSNKPNKTRIDTVVNWFASEKDPINFGVIYFNEPDHSGHIYGPDAPEMIDMIVGLDSVFGYLIESFENHTFHHHLNIIVTSDHGMESVSEERLIVMNDHVDPSWYDYFGGSPVWNIQPKEGHVAHVYDALKNVSHLNVYYKADVPADYHYQHNRRIMPIVAAAHAGYTMVQDKADWGGDGGDHGYNNSVPSMHPFFLAKGPAFKEGYVSEPFENVDIYPLMCHILGLEPHANDGQLDRVEHLLEDDDDEEEKLFGVNMTLVTILAVMMFASLVSGVMCIATCRMHRRHVHTRKVMMVPLNNVQDGQVSHS